MVDLRVLRSGNIIAAVVPGKSGNKITRRVIVAMVSSVWKCHKKPKLVTTSCPLSHAVALRCVEFAPLSVSISSWRATESSVPWVLKPEALIAILAPLSEEDIKLGTETLDIKLSGESVEILDKASSAGEWWPTPETEPQTGKGCATNGLFVSRKRMRGSRATESKQAKQKNKRKFVYSRKKTSKKKDKKGKEAASKESGAIVLKKAAEEKPIPFQPENLRRSSNGCLLVPQMLIEFKKLEEINFKKHMPSFNVDNECMLTHEKCKGMSWEKVVSGAHPYLCAVFLIQIQILPFFVLIFCKDFSSIPTHTHAVPRSPMQSCFRYNKFTSKHFGRVVFDRFTRIQKELEQGETRKAWLILLRDICFFLNRD